MPLTHPNFLKLEAELSRINGNAFAVLLPVRGMEMDWPAWALVAALFATPEDRGIGDTIIRVIGPPLSEPYKRHHEAVFGLMPPPCGCASEPDRWNLQWPYEWP